jgi:DNA repair protein RecO (recombination protein O)
MAHFTTDAVVLRAYKLGETSKVVVLLTRERGKLRAVARGARGGRPRYRSALEPLSEVRASLHGRQGAELLRLGEAELLHSAFPAGQRGLETSLFLSYCAEIVEAFSPEGEAEERVYRLVTAVVGAAEAGADPELLARYLEAWLLRLAGLYPSLAECAACAAGLPAGPLAYHATARGFVCTRCRPGSGPELTVSARATLGRVFTRAPLELDATDAATSRELAPFHRELVTRHLERELRSSRVIREVERGASR